MIPNRSAVRRVMFGAVMAAVALAAGCGYYRVTDPQSKNEYYTTKIDHLREGAIKFNDDKTGRSITLQSSEIAGISEATYRENVPKK